MPDPQLYSIIDVSPEWIEHMCACCPRCGLRTVTDDRCSTCLCVPSKMPGPFVDAPILAEPVDFRARCERSAIPTPEASARTSDAVPVTAGTASAAEGSAYDEPVEPPPTVVPITPTVGVERVLAPIEARARKRKKKVEQGTLF